MDAVLQALDLFHANLCDYAQYSNDPVGFCEDILKVKLTAKQIEIALSAAKHPRTFVQSANGCLAAETEIFDPIENANRRLDSIHSDWHVVARNHFGQPVIAKANKPRITGYEDLYKIQLSNGESFIAPLHHRIFSSGQTWTKLLQVFSCPHRSILEPAPLMYQRDDLHYWYTVGGCQSNYLTGSHPYDARLQKGANIYGGVSPSQDDVLRHTPLWLHTGGRGNEDNDILFGRSRRPSTSRFAALLPLYGAFCNQLSEGAAKHTGAGNMVSSFLATNHRTVAATQQSPDTSSQNCISQPSPGWDIHKESCPYVTSTSFVRKDHFYDFHVPLFNNYAHAGIWHHNCGKSFILACLCIWYYCTHDPCLVFFTAPTARQVREILGKEIRKLYGDRPGIYPKIPRIETHPQHILFGYTAANDASFQGLHHSHIFAAVDEAVGVDASIWEALNGILIGGETRLVAICNPTDTTSPAYLEYQSGKYHCIEINGLEHPNILAELQGEPAPYPGAICLKEVRRLLEEWATEVEEPKDDDFQFDAKWWRPGPVCSARLLGRWPSQSSYAIFQEALFNQARTRKIPIRPQQIPCIGADIARYGDDMSCFHVRRDRTSLWHESHNGWGADKILERLKELCRIYWAEAPQRVPVFIDSTGMGGMIYDLKGDYNFVDINAANKAIKQSDYPNKRSELLFEFAIRLKELDLTQLNQVSFDQIKQQSIGITYKLDAKGRRVAEKKEITKERLGRSPDDLDAVTLAYYREASLAVPPPKPKDKKEYSLPEQWERLDDKGQGKPNRSKQVHDHREKGRSSYDRRK